MPLTKHTAPRCVFSILLVAERPEPEPSSDKTSNAFVTIFNIAFRRVLSASLY